MVQDKLIAMIETLAEKSEAGALEWEAAAGSSSYQTNFPRYTVTIYEHGYEDPDYSLTITNEQGETMETVRHSYSVAGTYQLLKTVYNVARRKVMGVDRAVDEILSSLQS